MAFTVPDLKLTVDKLAQITKALGGAASTTTDLQDLCDEAAADVARYCTGYVVDDLSQTNFTRAIALFRAYGYIGPIPKDIQANYDAVMKELEAIAKGERPKLEQTTDQAAQSAGNWGSKTRLAGT